jgi:hypothetical protein
MMKKEYDVYELSYHIDELKHENERLKELNTSMAWEIHEKDNIIEGLREQVQYLKDLLIHFDCIEEKKYH